MHPHISLFQATLDTLGQSVATFRSSKTALMHLSHCLEDVVLTRHIPALMFTGFQESSYWRQETERYRALAGVAKQVCIFAGKPLPPQSPAEALAITLAPQDPLRQEWFVLIFSDAFSVLLCGLDCAVPSIDEGMRQFDTVLTFSPAAINAVTDRLIGIVKHHYPEKAEALTQARHTYRISPPNEAIVEQILADFMQFEEKLHQALFQAERRQRDARQQLEIRVAQRTRELTYMNEQLRRMGRLKDEFVQNVSHELRTPVTSIKLYHHLLSVNPDKAETYMEHMGREVARLEHLVQDLLLLASLEHSQGTELTTVVIDLDHALHTLTADRQVLAQQRGLTLSYSSAPGLPPIEGDWQLLTQAFSALLTNAFNYTPPGGSISINAYEGLSGVTVDVHNDGPHIPQKEQQLIFERFYRGEAGVQSQRPGTGLGLPIAKEIVERHNGALKLDSAPERGVTFSVWLPYIQPG